MKTPILSIMALLICVNTTCYAQTSTIKIPLRYSKYPYQCQSIDCFIPDSEKRSRIKNAEELVRQYCSSSSTKDLSDDSCAREREHAAAVEQCLRVYCVSASCKKTDPMSGKCIGGTYFR